ncbi:MAG TPA: response regulator transcription factor, partial [Anaerolineae bacterium]|nr:response regulator transcription factor [Anaerolineae bacterium]
MSAKILVVDDDVSLVETITELLQDDGHQVLVAHTAEDGLQLALSAEPKLVLLDIMIPTMGGLEVCRRIRERSNMPVVFLTALGDVDSVVHGLNVGADDYLVKPYQPPELLARVNAHLRRAQREAPDTQSELIFGDGDFVIDMPARRVTVLGKVIDLTPREYDLLETLAQNAGRVITTAELIQTAWGPKFRDSTDNIKPYIHYLRKKVEQDP